MAEISLFNKILQRRDRQYGYFSVDACLQKSETGYEMVFGKAVAHEPNAKKVSQPCIDFGDYVYVSECFSVSELPSIIEEQHPKFRMGSYEFTLNNAFMRPSGMGRLPSNNIISEWPIDLLELRPNTHANYLSPKALVAHNATTLFHNQYDGIRRYMRLNISYNYNNGWIGAMLFVLPDYRLRICEIAGKENTLTIKIDEKTSLTDARLHCLVDGIQGREEASVAIEGPEIAVRLHSQVNQLEIVRVFITTENDGTIDSYEQLPTYHSGQSRWLAGAKREEHKDIFEEIGKGEGPNLEFKPFIKIGKGEKKEIEIIRAVIAFANTGGGAILFGVNNLIEIEGIEKDLAAYAPTMQPVAAAELYGRQLRTLLNDVTSRRLDLQATVIEISNHILLRLFVAELSADEKPVWKLATNDIWIRNGSNNHKPDPLTIRNLFPSQPDSLRFHPKEWMS